MSPPYEALGPVDPVELADDYRALREEAGVVELARDFVRVSGPQALEYLQGQLSQDVEAIAPGSSALSLLLEPQGKVSAFLRLTRLGADEFLLDVDGGFGEATLARLVRFKLRTKADFELLSGWSCLAVRGPAATDAPLGDGSGAAGAADGSGDGLSSVFPWPGISGTDRLGPSPSVPPGLRRCSRAAYEAVRIEAGLPIMGAELDEGTIPEEAGVVSAAVSFTKGCYTGQELVARIDSRGGNVARRLRAVVALDGKPDLAGGLTPGASLWVGESEVGRLTSAAVSPRLGAIGLAYVHRKYEVPLEAESRIDPPGSAGRAVALRSLPLGDAG